MPIQTSFNAGEIGPDATGRIDVAKYQNGVKLMKNYFARPQGPAIRRSGSKYIGSTKYPAKQSRLIKFEYNVEQTYILEVGDYYIRFFKDDGQVVGGQVVANGSFEYEGTPPTPDDWAIHGAAVSREVDKTIFLAPEASCKVVTSAAGTGDGIQSSTFSVVNAQEYEYSAWFYTASSGVTMDVTVYNGSGTLVTADTGNALTQNSWTKISGTYTENAGGSGAYVVIEQNLPASAETWYVDLVQIRTTDQPAEIVTPYAEDEIWDVYITQTNDIAYLFHPKYPIRKLIRFNHDWWDLLTPTITSEPSKWSASAGYPTCGTFYGQRLWVGGVPSYPDWLWASMVGAYEDFTVNTADNDALELQAATAQANVVEWIAAGRKLNFGTSGGAFWIGADNSSAITPTDKNYNPASDKGSISLKPIRADQNIMYIQRPGKILRELTYDYSEDGYAATDHSILASHLMKNNTVVDLDSINNPFTIIFPLRDDGVLTGMTYLKQEEVYGWHRHILGGTFGNGHAVIESVRCTTGAGDDEIWMIVKRTIDGSTARYVERISDMFKKEDTLEFAFFVDSGLTLDGRIAIESVSTGTTTVLTVTGHPYSDGDDVRIRCVGLEHPTDSGENLHFKPCLVDSSTANTFEVTDLDGNSIDTTNHTTFIEGTVAELVDTISGLGHLEGEEVQVMSDGGADAEQEVVSGSITLLTKGSIVSVGLQFQSDVETLPPVVGDKITSQQNETKRITHVALGLDNTVGTALGPSFDELDTVQMVDDSVPFGQPPPLFSDNTEWYGFDGGWERNPTICIRQDQPYPSTIVTLMTRLELGEE